MVKKTLIMISEEKKHNRKFDSTWDADDAPTRTHEDELFERLV